jgi:AraC-like DNA-binding protein
MEINENFEKLLTVRDMAQIIGCSQKQVYRYYNKHLFDACLVRFEGINTIRFHPQRVRNCIGNGGFTTVSDNLKA